MLLSFSAKIRLRNPFRVISLPLLARLYILGYGNEEGKFHKFIGRPIGRRLHRLGMQLNLTGKGEFLYMPREDSAPLKVHFDGANTQFHSLYLPRYTYYEAETLAVLDRLLTGTDVFYDAGSNWGHFSLHAASLSGYSGGIYAFEPMPSTFRDLSDIVSQAGLNDRVKCMPVALSDKNEDAFMLVPDGLHSGNALLGEATAGIKVKKVKLDDLKVPGPAVIKMDAEGHEAEIICGGKKLIAEHTPFILFENFRSLSHPETTMAPLCLLKDMGYHFFVPLFFKRYNGYPVHEGRQDAPPDTSPEALIGLFGFEPEERFFLEEQVNILACHTGKLSMLSERLGAEGPL